MGGGGRGGNRGGGGRGGGGAEEKRKAPDGNLYSKGDFLKFFNGFTEWDAAVPAASARGGSTKEERKDRRRAANDALVHGDGQPRGELCTQGRERRALSGAAANK